MTIQQLRIANLGKCKSDLTGASGVGYTVHNHDGTVYSARSTAGVYQMTSGSGIYAAYITFPTDFRGSVFWDSGEPISTIGYAAEQYNVEENDPKVALTYTETLLISGTVDYIKHIESGRWRITSNQMIFYKQDNTTEIARFDLFDLFGAPTMDDVAERVKV